MEDRVCEELKGRLDTIRHTLESLTVKHQQATSTPSQREQAKKCRTAPKEVTKDDFLAAQRSLPRAVSPVNPSSSARRHQRQEGKDDFLMDLITRPGPSRPHSTVARSARATPRNTQAVNHDSFPPSDQDDVADEELSSRPSSGLEWLRQGRAKGPYGSPRSRGAWKRNLLVPFPGSPITQADYVEDSEAAADVSNGPTETLSTSDVREEMIRTFERRLAEEKERLNTEFERALASLAEELEEARNKRQADRDTHLKAQDRLEKDLRDARDELTQMNDQLRSMRQEQSAQKTIHADAQKEIERLEKELVRAELRSSKLGARQEEMQTVHANLRRESQDLLAKVSEQEKEISRLKGELNSKEVKLNDQFNLNNQTAERSGRMEAERVILQEDMGKIAKENNLLRAEKAKADRELDELSAQLQRLETRINERERACRMAEDRIVQLKKDFRSEAAERERAQSTVAELMGKNAELIHLKSRLADMEASAEALSTSLRNCQIESDRAHTVAERLRHEKGITEAEKISMESEISRLKAELRDLRGKQRAVSSRPTGQSAKDVDMDLTDVDGRPIERLGVARNRPQTRPHWWHTEPIDMRLPARSVPVVVPRRGRDSGYDDPPRERIRRGLVDDVVIPVDRVRSNTTSDEISSVRSINGPLELLKAEKKELGEALKSLPRNPAFRTSDQCEKYQKLYKEMEKLDREIRQVSSAGGSLLPDVRFDTD